MSEEQQQEQPQQVVTEQQVEEDLTLSLIQAVEHLQQQGLEGSPTTVQVVTDSGSTATVQVISDSSAAVQVVSDSSQVASDSAASVQVVSDSTGTVQIVSDSVSEGAVQVVSDSTSADQVVSDSTATVQVEAHEEPQPVYVQENNVVEIQVERKQERSPEQYEQYVERSGEVQAQVERSEDFVDRNDAVQALVQIESGIVHMQPDYVEGIVEGQGDVQAHVQVGSSRHDASQYVDSNGTIQAHAHVQIETSKDDANYAIPMEIHVHDGAHQAAHDYDESPHPQAHVQVRSEKHHSGYDEESRDGDELEMDDSEMEALVTLGIAEFIQGLDDNLRDAVDLVRKGTHLHKAAKIAGVQFLDLETAVKELKSRGDLRIDSCRKTVRAKKEDDTKKTLKRQFIDWNYTAEDVQAAAKAVEDGEHTVKSAHRSFKVPERAINRALKGEKVEGRVCTPGRIRLRKRGKLTEEEEKVIVEYSLALHRLRHPVTIKAVFPLAKQLLQLRDETIKDEHGWWEAFVKRHQELASFWITNKEASPNLANRLNWTKQYFERIVSVFETHNFFAKPSRIYACEVFQFEIEQWEKKHAKIVQVEILVAANAVGYHVLPPCVVYASEGEEIPDFMGLPEAGFVSSEEKKVSTAILVEWFRSVFLHYLPARSQDDPLVLILRGKNEWLTPELITLAEQQHVHLVPVPIICLNYLSPLFPLMHNLKDAYKKKLHEYKQANLLSQVRKPKDETFYPVTLRKLFSSTFSMYEIQESFKATGVFPLKPDEVDVSKPSPIETKYEIKEATEDIKKKRMLGIALGRQRTPGFRKYSDMVFTDLDSPKPKPPPVVQPQPLTFQNHVQVPLPGGGFMLYPQAPVIQSGSTLLNLAPSNVMLGGRPALVNLSNLQPLATSLASVIPVASLPSTLATLTSTATTSTGTASTTSTATTPPKSADSPVKFVKLTKGVGEEVTTSILNDSNKNDEPEEDSSDGEIDGINDDDDYDDYDPDTNDDEDDDYDPSSKSTERKTRSKRKAETTKKNLPKTQDDATTKPSDLTATRRSTRASKPSFKIIDRRRSQEDTAATSVSADKKEVDSPVQKSTRKSTRSNKPLLTIVDVRSVETENSDKKKVETSADESSEKNPKGKSFTIVDKRSANAVTPAKSPVTPEKSESSGKKGIEKVVVALTKKQSNKAKNSDKKDILKVTIGSSKKQSNKVSTKEKPNKKPTTKKSTKDTSSGIRNFTQNAGSKYLFSPTVKTPENKAKADDDGDDDLAGFNSDDEDAEKKPQEYKKSQEVSKEIPAPTQAPKVSLKSGVPSSVLDRIEAMISGNDALLTSLTTKEVAARVKPPAQPSTPKPAPPIVDPNESVESRLSKAFSADVLSSVMAVKQDLAKRPPLLYQDPPVTVVNPLMLGGSIVTLPKTSTPGPIVLPTGTLIPVHQSPMIISAASVAATSTTPAVATSTTPAVAISTTPAESQKSSEIETIDISDEINGENTSPSESTASSKSTNLTSKKSTDPEISANQKGPRLRKSSQHADENEDAIPDPDYVVKISEQDATPVRKSTRKPKPKAKFDDEDNTVTKESQSPTLEGSRKRKASLTKKQNEETSESPKRSKVELANVSSGRSTRSSSKDAERGVRTRSLKK